MLLLHQFQFPPLFYAVIALICSVSALFFGYTVSSLFIISAISIIVVRIVVPNYATWLPLALVMFASASVGIIRYVQKLQKHENFYINCANSPCTIIGTIDALEEVNHLPLKQLMRITTTTLTNNATQKSYNTPYTLHLYSHSREQLQVGDRVHIDNLQIKRNANRAFDHYLIKEQVAAIIFAPTLKPILIHRPTYSIRRTLADYRNSLIKALKRKMPPTTFSFFSSLFLGKVEKQQEDSSLIKKQCSLWGISHYLARSGLHLVIFILFWQLLCKILPIHLFYKNILLMLIISFYALLSWSSISFYRAFLSLIIAKGFSLTLIQTNTLQTLSLVCFLILIYNPLHLFFPDFQLSFLLTFALVLYNHLQTHKKAFSA